MIKKIVLTGGPSSGKTTVIEGIKKYFGSRYKVIVVDETASYLINMGIRPFGEGKVKMLDFQELVLKTQLAKEAIIDRSIELLEDENIIVVYDRGILDNCAYISEEEFQEILGRLKKKYTISDFMKRYDLVLNLVSRKDLYTTDNNPARSEDAETALELGRRTLYSWIGHNNLKIVQPKDDIEDKVNEVINHINSILEEKEIKKQKKYLVDLETTNLDEIISNSKKAKISQTYLESDPSVEKRLRKTIIGGVKSYTYTIFKTLDDGRKIKISEESISKKMYKKLLEFQDTKKKIIEKDRYYFSYQGQYFMLDIIDGFGILEINVDNDDKITIPPFISVLEDVTDNHDYLNTNIANKGIELIKK